MKFIYDDMEITITARHLNNNEYGRDNATAIFVTDLSNALYDSMHYLENKGYPAYANTRLDLIKAIDNTRTMKKYMGM